MVITKWIGWERANVSVSVTRVYVVCAYISAQSFVEHMQVSYHWLAY